MSVNYLLKEDGDYLLQEDETRIIVSESEEDTHPELLTTTLATSASIICGDDFRNVAY